MVLYFLFIISFFQGVYAQLPGALVAKGIMQYDLANNVLNTVMYRDPSPSIITEREREEFHLDHLITILDRTETSFGRWALSHLLNPVADIDELMVRKNIITFLIEHEKELSLLSEQLKNFILLKNQY